jgi:LL-diaminopimelate aminotransferase
MPSPSTRLDKLPPYFFSVIADRIHQLQKQGMEVYRLDMGNPDLPPPPNVIQKLAASAHEANNHGYIGYRGKASFRKAVADYYLERFGVSLDPETQILPVIGSKEGLINLSLAYLAEGDLGLVPDIAYPSYEMGIRLAGAEFEYIHLDPNKRFLPDLDAVNGSTLDRAKMLWINYPNNPTGMCASIRDLQAVTQICAAHDILLVSDNPYVNVTFDGNHGYSILQTTGNWDNIVEFLSFSKSYNMGGWRLGAAVGSANAIKNLLQIKSNIDSGHFGPIYDAGVEALSTPQQWIDSRNAIYQRRRDKILEVLPYIGLSAMQPEGTLYVWASVQDYEDSADYVEDALTSARVSLGPGAAYGPGGKGFVRISLGISDDRLDQALEHLQNWYAQRA